MEDHFGEEWAQAALPPSSGAIWATASKAVGAERRHLRRNDSSSSGSLSSSPLSSTQWVAPPAHFQQNLVLLDEPQWMPPPANQPQNLLLLDEPQWVVERSPFNDVVRQVRPLSTRQCVDVTQAAAPPGIATRQMDEPKLCRLCKNNGEPPFVYTSHNLREGGKIKCWVLARHTCEICGATGDNAHTKMYCPHNPYRRATQRRAPAVLLKNTKYNSTGQRR